jgi:ferredoxin like protein
MNVNDIDRVRINAEQLYGPRMSAKQIREHLKGKYEVIPKKEDHIKVDQDKCNGCELCYIICPCGCYEMEANGKAKWAYGQLCSECGTCNYVCPVNAIDWSYPEGGTGMVLKFS